MKSSSLRGLLPAPDFHHHRFSTDHFLENLTGFWGSPLLCLVSMSQTNHIITHCAKLAPLCSPHRIRCAAIYCSTQANVTPSFKHRCFLWILFSNHFVFFSPLLGQCVSRSIMSDSAIPWTITCHAPLSLGFPRHEYWSGSPFPSPLVSVGIRISLRLHLCAYYLLSTGL